MAASTFPSPHVVLADADPLVANVLARALHDEGITPAFADGVDAVKALAQAERGPHVIVIDWALWRPELAECCRDLREKGRVHVIAAVAGGRPKDSNAALEAGADECLPKPVAPHELVARVRWAGRMLAAIPAPSADLRAALARAAREGSGEVAISAGASVGRIYFDQGAVVWAKLSDRPFSLDAILEGNAALGAAEVREVLAESRRTGKNVLEVLVEWQLASRGEVLASVRRYLQDTVRAMFQLPSAQVVFAPAMRPATWTGPRFPLHEIIPAETRRALPALRVVPAPSPGGPRCRFAEQCTSCERLGKQLMGTVLASGVDGIAIVHGASGEPMAKAGDAIDPDVIRGAVRIMAVVGETDHAEDVVVSSAGRHVMLSTTACPDAFVALVADRKRIGLGALKHEAARLAGRIFPDERTTEERERPPK